jgi:UDP-N-acetylmuramate dehydrogenase
MEIKENIPLSQYTTLKIGGPARFFTEAGSEDEILGALNFAKEKGIPVFILGGGSNILVSDKGFDGLVIKTANCKLQIANLQIICDSGCSLSKVVSESIEAGFAGLEWAAGIPGTLGGAIRGNAGAFGSSISETVDSVKVIDTKKINADNQEKLRITNYELRDCGFSYRESIFKQNPNLIVLSVILSLKKGKREENEKKVKEIIRQRKEAQPFDFPSSGSFFKNPICKNKELIEEYKKDTGKEAKDEVIPAGYIIDVLGLRGKKIGGAMVSQHHGNFLVNTGKATSEDFIILAAIIKTRVRNEYGIQLQEEVQRVGF